MWRLINQFEAVAFGFDGVIARQNYDRPGEPFVPTEGSLPYVHRLMTYRAGRVGIATTTQFVEVVPFLQTNKLGRYIPDERIVSDENTPLYCSVPEPFAYTELAERMNVSKPADMLVIVGSSDEITAANRAGCLVIALALTSDAADLQTLTGDEQPDWVVEDYQELAQLTGV